jgi:splicing factor 3A subunit 1
VPKPAAEQTAQSQAQVTVTVPKSQSVSGKASALNPIAKILATRTEKAPSPHEFCLAVPSGVSALDMDIIKLTAQYTAVGGREFLSGLAAREQRNAQFDFLKPTHMLFSYFTALVDAYTKVLHPDEALRVTVEARTDKGSCLEQVVRRWDWTRTEERRKARESVEADEERAAFMSVDWFDFVVVETILFPADEVLVAAPLADLLRPSAPEAQVSGLAPSLASEEEIDEEEEEEQDPDIKVVSDYVPRVGQRKVQVTMVDPISGRALPESEVAEHMRVQLLDPRWRLEQQRFLEKQQDSSFATGSSIASNLKEFARKRYACTVSRQTCVTQHLCSEVTSSAPRTGQ